MTHRLPLALLPVVAAAALAAPARAVAEGRRGSHEHDGFFWRPLALGYGYEFGIASDGDISRRLHVGNFVAVPLFTAGKTLEDDLVVYGSLTSMHIATAQSSTAETRGDRSTVTIDGLMQLLLCVGFERYFMPSNVFAGVEFGPVSFDLDAEGRDAVYSWGFRVQAHVGHEWWLSDDWAMGFAGQLAYTIAPDIWMGEQFVWHLFGIALLGTITYQ